MVEYRLTVVKLSGDGPNGGYQIFHYHKAPQWYVPNMDEVLIHMGKLQQNIPSAIKPEPTLIGLNEDESKRVMRTREWLLKNGLELRV
ncbi:hypothetical protein HYX11_01700 [Candidatus Woesearchaeota archaeon]|nr:hypothetical protein [Candidatus Woesearchaeota archaeon]